MTEQDEGILAALKAANPEWGAPKLATESGLSRSAVGRWLTRVSKDDDFDGFSIDGFQNTVTSEIGKINEPIKTIEDLLEYADINTDDWEVSKQVVNCWGDNYQAKAWLKPREEKPILKAINSLEGWKPVDCDYKHEGGEVMAVLSLFDQHFGKLAWKEETNSDYDLKIAADLFNKAGYRLLQKVKGFGIEKIVFPLGSDFLHIDNAQNTTTGGTQQDVDSRLFKIYAMAKKCVIQLVHECLKIAPVEVVYVPGNHDYTVAWYLTDTIDSWFRECEEVTVCQSPQSRKYLEYGVNLIGLCHGDAVKMERLALLIMDENKANLADKLFLEWLTGHYHKKGEKMFHAGDSFGSVVIKSIPSLCGTDAWHFLHGFVNSRRAAEIMLYDKEDGPCGTFPIHIDNL